MNVSSIWKRKMSQTIRLFGIVEDSIVDGPGLRLGVFTQGCPHKCLGCHNPNSHDCAGGYLEETAVIVKKALNNPLCSGVTFSGGEPLMQISAILEIAKQLKEANKHIILYTGFVFEEFVAEHELDLEFQELLTYLDVIIDGPYIQELRTLSLPFRGSSNQRMIDIQEFLKQKQIVTI